MIHHAAQSLSPMLLAIPRLLTEASLLFLNSGFGFAKCMTLLCLNTKPCSQALGAYYLAPALQQSFVPRIAPSSTHFTFTSQTPQDPSTKHRFTKTHCFTRITPNPSVRGLWDLRCRMPSPKRLPKLKLPSRKSRIFKHN